MPEGVACLTGWMTGNQRGRMMVIEDDKSDVWKVSEKCAAKWWQNDIQIENMRVVLLQAIKPKTKRRGQVYIRTGVE